MEEPCTTEALDSDYTIFVICMAFIVLKGTFFFQV